MRSDGHGWSGLVQGEGDPDHRPMWSVRSDFELAVVRFDDLARHKESQPAFRTAQPVAAALPAVLPRIPLEWTRRAVRRPRGAPAIQEGIELCLRDTRAVVGERQG